MKIFFAWETKPFLKMEMKGNYLLIFLWSLYSTSRLLPSTVPLPVLPLYQLFVFIQNQIHFIKVTNSTYKLQLTLIRLMNDV